MCYWKRQAQLYCKVHKFSYVLTNSQTTFKFGYGCYDSLVQLFMRIPTPNGSFIERKFDVVKADTPMLIGLDMLDAEGIYANNVVNKLIFPKLNWNVPI